MKCRAHLGQCPCRTHWSLSCVDSGSTCRLGLWQTQCGPSTASTPHTCQQYLFAVSLPPHNTTEQVSLNKWPPLSPCFREEIRHWRDLQTEEAKINKGRTAMEVTVATIKNQQLMLKLCIWREAIDLEKSTARTRDYLILNWPYSAHNSSREIPRYTFTIIIS